MVNRYRPRADAVPERLSGDAVFRKLVILSWSVQSDGVVRPWRNGMKLKPVLLLATTGFAISILPPVNSQTRSKKNVAPVVLPDVPAGFDNKSNGLVDDATH